MSVMVTPSMFHIVFDTVVAASGELGLVGALGSADVRAGDGHAGKVLHQRPRIAGRRHLVQHHLVEVGDVALALDVEHRGGRRDDQLLGDAASSHLDAISTLPPTSTITSGAHQRRKPCSVARNM